MKNLLTLMFYLSLTTSLVEAAKTHTAKDDNMSFVYGACSDIDDPYEGINRKIFMFNSILDHFLLRPVAKGYNKIFDEPTKARVANAMDNAKVPLTMVNNVLQVDGKNALRSFWQFAINTTFGTFGMQDIAGARGLHVEPQTLGSTLARYGVGPGPYIVLPIYGSTNLRDILDKPFANGTMNPLHYYLSRSTRGAIAGVTLVEERASILPFTDYISRTSTDPYLAIRSAIHQRREGQVSYPSNYYCTKGRLK
jgi:phospholipid-binding lipoprotein MlaA